MPMSADPPARAAVPVDGRTLSEALLHTHSMRGSRVVCRATRTVSLLGLPFSGLAALYSVSLALVLGPEVWP